MAESISLDSLRLTGPLLIFTKWILTVLAIAVFVPIKYVHPTRLDYFSKKSLYRALVLVATILWGISCLVMLYQLPTLNYWLLMASFGYVLVYFAMSLYQTIKR